MKKFEVGERYRVHGSTQGMLVTRRWADKLLCTIDGVEMEKSVGHFIGAEIVWTDDWHVAIAYKKQEEVTE
ncbi:hypothetical protein [Jeotgalibaca porci]|uniref:hypothetical protein n=1 Tax=Jeotgalibaca porci TaxID=1868793 RepID=UPI0035A11C59